MRQPRAPHVAVELLGAQPMVAGGIADLIELDSVEIFSLP